MKHISHLLRGVVYLVSLIAAFAAGAVTPSGTLPLLTIETENRVPVPAKTEPYAMATYTLAANGTEITNSAFTADAGDIRLNANASGRGKLDSISATANGAQLYQRQVFLLKGTCSICVTSSSFFTDTTVEQLALFEALS